MATDSFLDIAVKNLPGGLILVDLKGKIQAINKTAETLLGLSASWRAGDDCQKALAQHSRIAQILTHTCKELKSVNREELVTQKPGGETIVLGYGTLLLKDDHGSPIGVGFTFQDITRFIPLMDAHEFLDVAMKNLPGGLIFIDLKGKVRAVNQTAERILGLKGPVDAGTPCDEAFVGYAPLVKVLLSTTQSLQVANRQELTTKRGDGEKLTLGYGTLVIKNPQGVPIGIGMTFQDITRYIPLPLKSEFIRLVDRFFTPFALALVTAGLFIGYAETWAKQLGVALVVALGLFNEISAYLSKRHEDWAVKIGATRIVTNFAANVYLVYLLGTFWGPMWLLFVLTPVATALYADWKKTFITSLISAGALLAIYWSRGLEGAVGWGQASIHATFIVFISLFVNSIARLIMQMRAPTTGTIQKPTLKVHSPDTSDTPKHTRLAA